jgi:hypothetical protein
MKNCSAVLQFGEARALLQLSLAKAPKKGFRRKEPQPAALLIITSLWKQRGK